MREGLAERILSSPHPSTHTLTSVLVRATSQKKGPMPTLASLLALDLRGTQTSLPYGMIEPIFNLYRGLSGPERTVWHEFASLFTLHSVGGESGGQLLFSLFFEAGVEDVLSELEGGEVEGASLALEACLSLLAFARASLAPFSTRLGFGGGGVPGSLAHPLASRPRDTQVREWGEFMEGALKRTAVMGVLHRVCEDTSSNLPLSQAACRLHAALEGGLTDRKSVV